MKQPNTTFYPPGTRTGLLVAAAAILVFAVLFRAIRATALPELPNFSPLMAVAFCGGLFLPAGLAIFVPLAALVASDIFLNLNAGFAPLGGAEVLRYSCYLFAVAAGLWARGRGGGFGLLAGCVLANAVVFYLVSNTASWAGNPAYAQSVGGWVQALTSGIPGYPPTWTFFRNSLVSDALFTGFFVAAMRVAGAGLGGVPALRRA